MSAAIKALIKAQAAMGKAVKSSKNPHFKSKYADLESVINATMPAFNSNGFAVMQRNGVDEMGHWVSTELHHESGEHFDSKVYLLIGKNDMQGLGSAITYARRYGLLSMAGIAPEDDDGNAAVANKQASKPQMTLDAAARVDAAVQFYENCDQEKFEKFESRYEKLLNSPDLTENEYERLLEAHEKRKVELMV